MNSSVKAREKVDEESPEPAKDIGTFLFGVILKQENNPQAAFQISTCILHWNTKGDLWLFHVDAIPLRFRGGDHKEEYICC